MISLPAEGNTGMPMDRVVSAGVGYLTAKRPRRSRCVLPYSSELTQALRSFLTATRDSKPAIIPRSQIGLVGTGVALDGGVSEDGGGAPEGGGTKVSGPPTTNGSLVADAGLVPIMFVAVTKHSYVSSLYIEGTVIGDVGPTTFTRTRPEPTTRRQEAS
jgi:hypothetical protein